MHNCMCKAERPLTGFEPPPCASAGYWLPFLGFVWITSHHCAAFLPKILSSHQGSLLCCFLLTTRGSQGVSPEFLSQFLPSSPCLWISSLLSLLSSFLRSFPPSSSAFSSVPFPSFLSLCFLLLFVWNLKYYSCTFHTVASHHRSISNLFLVFKICLEHVWYFPNCYLHTEIMAMLYSLVSNGLLVRYGVTV